MNRFTSRMTALVCCLAATAAVAQQASASMNGAVRDDKGRPVLGAKVIITSPALFSERVFATDAKGEWRASLLPLGTYRVVVAKDGYISGGVQGVHLGLGVVSRQDVTLRTLAVVAATVEVVSDSVALPKTDTKTASNYSQEELATIPTQDRGFFGATMLTPGVVNDTSTFRPTIRGGTTNNTMYQVNGAEVKNESRGYFGGDNWFVEDNVEDIQVLLSPLNARLGRVLGGAINVTTKTGTDEFHGSIRANASRLNWKSTRPQDDYRSINQDTISPRYDITFNGPIIPGRLRFAFATILVPGGTDMGTLAPGVNDNKAVRTVRTSSSAINGVTDTDPSTFLPTAGSLVPAGYRFTRFDAGSQIARKDDYKYYEGKITFSINADHSIEAGYLTADRTKGPTDYYDDLWNTSAIAALGNNVTSQRNYSLVYRGILSPTWFVEGRFNRAQTDQTYGTGDVAHGGDRQKVMDVGALGNGNRTSIGYPFGYESPGADGDRNTSANINFTKNAEMLGNHEIEFGVDYYRSQRIAPGSYGTNHALFRAPGMFINGSNDIVVPAVHVGGVQQAWVDLGQSADGYRGPIPQVYQFFGKGGTYNNDHQALYANDQWTINTHWNLMAGLRWEKFIAKNSDGTTVFSTSDFSPRLQLRYDVKGDNTDLITLTAARLLGYLPQAFTKSLTGAEDQIEVDRQFTGIPGQPVAGSNDIVNGHNYYGVRFLSLDQLYDVNNYKKVLAFSDTSKTNRIEGKLKVPYMDEFTLGFAHNFKNNSSFRITYVNRSWRRDWAFAQDYAPDQMVLLTDPTNSGLPSMYSQTTRIFNSSELKRDYQALELDFTVRKGWYTFGGNWTYSRLTGNNEGSDVANTMIASYGVSGYYNQRNWQVANGKTNEFAPYGPLGNDQTHRMNLYLTTLHPAGNGRITTGWFLRYSTGANFGSTADVDFNPGISKIPDNNGAAYPGAPSTYSKFFGGRNANTGNDTWLLNCQINYEVPLWRQVRIFGEIKIDNVLNHFVDRYNRDFSFTDTTGNKNLVLDVTKFGTTEPGKTNNYWNEGRKITASLGFRF